MRFRRKIISMDVVTVPRNVSIFTKKKFYMLSEALEIVKKGNFNLPLFLFIFYTFSCFTL